MLKQTLFAASLLLAFVSTGRCEPPCTATTISRIEAERLVMSVADAVTARKIGGQLSVVEWKPEHASDVFYYFMLLSTVSAPSTPLDNGMLGYFSVNKITGRVVDVAGGDAVGVELERLQATLRAKHCIDEKMIATGKNVEP